MIDITVGNIKEELHAHINNIMSDFQTIESITSGDIEPLEYLNLDNKVEELAIVIRRKKTKQYAVGQYFDIFVSTNNYPLWRLFHFMIKAETETTYILQSVTMGIEVQKELFPNLIKNGIVEKDCVKIVML